MALKGVRGIIFDFGGVFTKTRARRALLSRYEAELGLAPGELTSLLFASEHWRAVSTGRISADRYWRHVCQALCDRVPSVLEPFKYNPFAHEQLNRRMIALARRLHRRHRTALLSNATPYLDSLLAERHLTGLFDTVVNSARVGLRKPNPAIYELTVTRLGLRPAECLFVDDKERNTIAAEALGMKAIVFRSAADLQRQLKKLE